MLENNSSVFLQLSYNYTMRFIGYDSILTRGLIYYRFQIRTIAWLQYKRIGAINFVPCNRSLNLLQYLLSKMITFISNSLVSANQGIMSSRAINSVNFRLIFTNDNNRSFVDSSDFRAEPFFPTLVHISFFGIPVGHLNTSSIVEILQSLSYEVCSTLLPKFSAIVCTLFLSFLCIPSLYWKHFVTFL